MYKQHARSWKRAFVGVAAAAITTVGALAVPGLSTTSHAEAATITLHAVRGVYLRTSPRIARNARVFERAGSTFDTISGSTSGWWHVRDSKGRRGYVIRKTYWVRRGSGSTSSNVSSVYKRALPPGVRYDSGIRPRAGRSASRSVKANAVLAVARSKMGTPYRWGHNEDRGQYGFDCSNFTAYVYHHALGYRMSGASKTQARSVGWRVSRSNMQVGDLIIFDSGRHVGIYAGNGRVIQEGGGLGKVGYLSIRSGSYWGRHITAVKRMFH